MAAFGIVLTTLGASLPVLIERFGIDKTQAGGLLGVVAAGVPFVLASLAGAFSQSAILAMSGLLVLIPLAVTMTTPFPPSKQPHGFPAAEVRGLLRDRVLLFIGVMLFLESGV